MENKLAHFPITKKLHTDILEEKYGPIHSEILEHNENIREVLLADRENITRTYALTFFPKVELDEEISEINREIKSGGMIGKTFRDKGYEVRKNVVDVFIIDIPNWLKNKFAVNEEHAKARISEFYAKKKDTEPVIYGYVLEVYTPDFRPAEINAIDMAQVNPSTEMFAEAGVSKDQVWNNLSGISETAGWNDMGDSFKEAKMKTRPFIFELRGKMEDRINSRK